MRITFFPQPYKTLSFVFVDAFILKNRNKGDEELRKAFIQVEIGEEILETEPKLQTKKALPNWEDNILTFRVHEMITRGKITIYETSRNGFLEVGNMEISLPNMLKEDGQLLYISDLTLKAAP